MHDLDTALLRTFVSLAETRSFSRTGDLIGRSQSAVSGQVQKLEHLIGRRLVDRDTRNVALTPDGEQLLTHARAMVAQADAMLARFRGPDLSGEVRFGSPEDFASHYLPDVLGQFAAAHPAVELHVTCQLTLPLVEDFTAGRFDLIVVKQDPARPFPGARPLWREELVWVASPRFVQSLGAMEPGRAAFPGGDLGRPVPLVLSPAPCVYRSRAMGALDAAHGHWTVVFVSPSFAGAVAAVRAGLGVMVMPRPMVPGGLQVLSGWPPLAGAEMALMMNARPAPAAAALAEFLAQRVTR